MAEAVTLSLEALVTLEHDVEPYVMDWPDVLSGRWRARSCCPHRVKTARWIFGRCSSWFSARRGFGQWKCGPPSWTCRAIHCSSCPGKGDGSWKFSPHRSPSDGRCSRSGRGGGEFTSHSWARGSISIHLRPRSTLLQYQTRLSC